MGNFPFGYQPIEPSTWAYLSSLLMLALFFKFNRFWSFRNFDLILLIMLAPGLLMVHYGIHPPQTIVESFSSASGEVTSEPNSDENPEVEQANQDESKTTDDKPGEEESVESSGDEATAEVAEYTDLQLWQRRLQRRGFLWLFGIGTIWVIRMLVDPSLIKKPFLEANLGSGGLIFLACSLMVFLFANIITSPPAAEDISGPRDAVKLMQTDQADKWELESLRRRGPGYALLHLFPTFPTFANNGKMLQEDADSANKLVKYEIAAKTMAILSQIAIVLALVFFGRNHFDDLRIGIAIAVIYLMLPYTAQHTGRTMHVLPAALLIWSLTMYRVPWASGILLGLAAAVAYYPLFLIPLFFSYYWYRGRTRFAIGLLGAISVAIGSLVFTSSDVGNFFEQLRAMFGFWPPETEHLEGIWNLGWFYGYRIPLLVGFVAMCITFAAWPAQKTVSSLLCCSCAAMVAVQFWHGFGGGLYMAWYLPIALLVFFRPNLDETTAVQMLPERVAKSSEG